VASHSTQVGNRNPVLTWVLRIVVVGYLFMLVIWPTGLVFKQAFADGMEGIRTALQDPDFIHALKLTAEVSVIAVLINLVFGVGISLLLVRFEFPGKRVLSALIDLPLSVSPVIAGLIYVLVFGRRGWLGDALEALDAKVIFALPGILLATTFVTFPLVVRELVPAMRAQGREQEEAAALLGASGSQTFFRVTLPAVRWALIYGAILCAARAIGEFGAVSVVSGHIRGATNTLPLHVEILYNEYQFAAAFAVASLLVSFALAILVVQALAGRRRRVAQAFATAGARA
jgi:sulfate/thiosulfate transport system permease protein